MSHAINLINKTFGQLLVISPDGKSSSGCSLWKCKCDCGNYTAVIHSRLVNGNTKSCGCLQRKTASEINTTHGHTKKQKWSKQYRTWINISQRCTNPNQGNYHLYGGRGITMCERWRKFENFLDDMGKPPTARHQIDRINNNEGYSPTNCRWATPEQNGRNKRNNHILTWNGMSKCLSQWSEEFCIPYCTLRMRIRRDWSIQKALTTPIRKKRTKNA